MMVDRDRLVTGLALIGLVLFICFMDSMFLTWVFLGILFIVSFYEAMKLLSIDDDSLYIYVGILWILALFYPTPDDLVYLLLVGYLSFMLYRQSVDLKKIYPFIYPTLSYLYILALYKEFGMDALLNRKLCSVDLAKKTIDSPRHGLAYLREHLSIEDGEHHRAYADALSAAKVLQECFKNLPENIKSTEELISFSQPSKSKKKRSTTGTQITT